MTFSAAKVILIRVSAQLRLFPPARPLVQRLGAEFFRSIPKEPGVYYMQDARQKIIYIGKAKNLRQRICSYKYLNPETASRKSIRLVHSVEKIAWELCASDLEAQIRENFLLRTHHPKFNSLHVYPKAYCFIGTKNADGAFEICLTREVDDQFELHGAFKLGTRLAYAALLRALWMLSNGVIGLTGLPSGYFGERPPRQAVFRNLPSGTASSIAEFLSGMSDAFLRAHEELQARADDLSSFERSALVVDLELLRHFFETATQRNRELKLNFGIATPVIPQEELNDWIVRSRFAAHAREGTPQTA